MSDYQQQQNYSPAEDPAASTQMFRAFVDEGRQQPVSSRREQAATHNAGGGGRGVGLVVGVIVAIVVVAAVAYLALK
jgi:hypothetical protein